MKVKRIALCYLFLFLLLGPHVQAQGFHTKLEPVRRFVQAFYVWYVPKASENSGSPAWALAIRTKSSLFHHELARALREDIEAQSKVEGEIVSLDFDSFLGSQAPEWHYKVGKII